MDLKELTSKKAQKQADLFIDRVEKGIIRKRTLPNTSDSFDEARVLTSMQKKPDTDIFEKIMTEAYE